jgi:tagaturonate epimerase
MSQSLAQLITTTGVLELSVADVESKKKSALAGNGRLLGDKEAGIYVLSVYPLGDRRCFIARIDGTKSFVVASRSAFDGVLDAPLQEESGIFYQAVIPGPKHLSTLQKLFPFTKPVSLREQVTTVGMGDRLGRASAGHLQSARKYQVSPVLAQQSIRELDMTQRTFADVVADAAFLVYQEGFEDGWGADGDHLKDLPSIDRALAQDMPMITLDLTEVMRPEVADFSPEQVDSDFAKMPEAEQKRIDEDYADKTFRVGRFSLTFTKLEARRCAVMYGPALDFGREVDQYLRKHRGDQYDLEISIDETTTPTLPEHHYFFARELTHRKVTVNSLAPRFIGEFQKAIDYIGDLGEFEEQFEIHCEIARAYGHYKISLHSGSDKLSVYPIVGRHTDLRLHLKTSGTSWLESLRVLAVHRPALYREIHTRAVDYAPEALRLYHITADFNAVTNLDSVSDAALPDYLDDPNARQLLHIAYGGIIPHKELGPKLYDALYELEEEYDRALVEHFDRHITLLGAKKRP